MAIKNYTTSIDVYKSLGEIQDALASHGARKIMRVGTQYNKTENEARKEWNHRAPLLTPTQMEALKQC